MKYIHQIRLVAKMLLAFPILINILHSSPLSLYCDTKPKLEIH